MDETTAIKEEEVNDGEKPAVEDVPTEASVPAEVLDETAADDGNEAATESEPQEGISSRRARSCQ